MLHNIGWCAPASISRNLVRSCHWYGWHSYACTSHLVMGRLRWSGPDGAVQQRALASAEQLLLSVSFPPKAGSKVVSALDPSGSFSIQRNSASNTPSLVGQRCCGRCF